MKKQTETLMLLTAIMMAACSADENVSTQTEAGDAVNFTVGMASGITRAFTYDNKWTLNDKIAIYDGSVVCQYEPQESSENSGDRVSLKPSTTTTATAFFWSPLVTSRTFSGWYPYAASKPSEISGATDQRSNTFYYDGNQGSLTNDQYNALDVLYAPDVQVGYKQQVDMTFYHQMCRIIVTVNSTATKGAKPVTSIVFGKNNVAAGGTLTPGYTGTAVNGMASWSISQNKSVQMRLNSRVYQEGNATIGTSTIRQATYECVVPPQSLARDAVLFQITTTDSNGSTTTTNYIPQDLYQDAPVFQAGYQYNYMLTLSRQGMVIISTVQVIGWATSNVNDLTATVPDAGY